MMEMLNKRFAVSHPKHGMGSTVRLPCLSQWGQFASGELGTTGPHPCKSITKGQVTVGRMQPPRSVFSHGSPALTPSLLGNPKVIFARLESSFGCSLGLHETIAWACRSLRGAGYQKYLQIKQELFPLRGTETWQAVGLPHRPAAAARNLGQVALDLRSCYQHPPQTYSISQSGSDLPGMRGFLSFSEELLLWQQKWFAFLNASSRTSIKEADDRENRGMQRSTMAPARDEQLWSKPRCPSI